MIDKEVEQMDGQTSVKVMVTAVPERTAHLIECTACGPVGVTQTAATPETLARIHLRETHDMDGATV